MQQMILNNAQRAFLDEVNAVLMDGWRVVPGTMYVQSVEMVSDPRRQNRWVSPSGMIIQKVYACVVEHEDV